MVTGNFKIALDSIRSAKLRSLLTMMGVIIGVVSVVTIVSIGEGVKKQISQQINDLGSDLVTVRAGKVINRDASGKFSGVNLTPALNGTPLTDIDYKVVKESPHVDKAVPISVITGAPRIENRDFPQASIFGTTKDLPEVLNHKVEYGAFIDEGDATKRVAVIGHGVAEDLFKEPVPIGMSIQIRGESFIVKGVFEEFETAALTPLADYNLAVFIPIEKGKKLSNNQSNIQQILVTPSNPENVDEMVGTMEKRLLNAHGGQEDFTILKQEDNLAVSNSILSLLTSLITGIAAVSLLVGGIGIMNVMLASVSERSKEIGIRKAVGATNQQILAQFMIESAVLSVVGGLIGVICSVLANLLLRIFTELQPVVTLPIMFIAVGVSLLVGVIFGVAPALQAARKDPIEVLRRI